MGDRANIVIESDRDMFPSPVYFYTHWTGYKIKEDLKNALIKGKGRWSDGSYLARVIFQTMIGEDDGITGYGISTTMGDGDDNVLYVNIGKKTVTDSRDQTWTFEDFVKD